MAHISSKEVKAIRDAVKKEFPNYKWSITSWHYSTIKICLMSADFPVEEKHQDRDFTFPERHENEKVKEVFEKVEKIMFSSKEYYDNSDSMTDYFHTSYYYRFSVGKYNKPYIQK